MEDEKKEPKAKPAPEVKPQATVAKEPTKTIALKVGEVIIAPVGDEASELKVTMSDWNRIYNAGKNAGQWVLKSEKKS